MELLSRKGHRTISGMLSYDKKTLSILENVFFAYCQEMFFLRPICTARSCGSMNFVEKILEALKDLARKVIETLLGPEVEPEPELIPIPVRDREYRR
jgi:hypothetical protein